MDEVLLNAQAHLGQALERAQGNAGGLAEVVRDLGLRFVQQLTGLLRLARMHALDNEAFNKPVSDFAETITDLAGVLGAIHVVAVEDQVYVNDVRVRLQNEEGAKLTNILRLHNVGGISFHSVLGETEIRALVECINASPARGARRRGLRRALKHMGVHGVDLAGVFLFKMGDEDDEALKSTVRMMERSHSVVEDAWASVGEQRVPNPLPIRRSVTEMLASGLAAEGLWDRFDDAAPHSRHSVRVARYALLMGGAIGLNPASMQDLGVAAVFHDIGYVAREGAVPAARGRPAQPGFPPPFERHGSAGARMLLKQRGFHEARVHRIRATLEHHKDHADPSGRPSLFARIIRIAEDFDNFSASRQASFSPAVALERMVPLAGTSYDPVLFKVFMNQVGKYPPGTLLELADGRIVCSRSLVRVPEAFDTPECFVVRQSDGSRPKVSGLIDLVWDGQVVSVVDPEYERVALAPPVGEDRDAQAFDVDSEPSMRLRARELESLRTAPPPPPPEPTEGFVLDIEDDDIEDDDSEVTDDEGSWEHELIDDEDSEDDPTEV